MSKTSDKFYITREIAMKKVTDYDEFVGEIGEFGLWQKVICLTLWIPAIAGGIHVLMYSFTGLTPKHYRCDISDCNATNYDGYIWEDEDQTQSCEYHEAVADDNGMCVRANTSVDVIRSCKQGPYIFEDFEFERTTITQFNILCERESFIISVRTLIAIEIIKICFSLLLLDVAT